MAPTFFHIFHSNAVCIRWLCSYFGCSAVQRQLVSFSCYRKATERKKNCQCVRFLLRLRKSAHRLCIFICTPFRLHSFIITIIFFCVHFFFSASNKGAHNFMNYDFFCCKTGEFNLTKHFVAVFSLLLRRLFLSSAYEFIY